MTLSPLTISKLNNVELAQFITRFLDDLDKSSLDYAGDKILTDNIASLRQELTAYKTAVKPIRSNSKSKELMNADKTRDEALRALKNGLKAYRHIKKEADKTAHDQLLLLMNHYQPAKGTSYETESLLLGKLLGKLTTSPHQELVNQLGLKRFVDDLSESQQAFETLFASRSLERLGQEKPNITALRQQLTQTYRHLSDYIDLMNQLAPQPHLLTLMTILNNSRHYFSDMIIKRHKPNKHQAQDQAQDQEPAEQFPA